MGCSPVCDVHIAVTPWIYFAGFLVAVVVAWVLRDYGAPGLNWSPVNECLPPPDASGAVADGCLGQSAVLRISFGNFLFFAAHLVVLLGVKRQNDRRLLAHTGFWPLQLLLWGGLIGACFAMPDSAIQGYGQAARVFSAIFILVQLIILLDFVYDANDWLLGRPRCAFALVAGSALLIVGSFVGAGFMFKFYAPSASCGLNIWFITSAILFFLVYGTVSVSPLRHESAGLFCAAAVFAYCTYYVWSALSSAPPGDCSAASLGQNKTIQIISFVLAIIAVAFTTTRSGVASGAFDVTAAAADSGAPDELPYRPDFFHAVFMLASAYMAMVLSGWELDQGGEGEFTLDKGTGSMWVKIVASWLCALLFLWSLVAHRVLRGRQF